LGGAGRSIVLADRGVSFDGRTIEERPLGGAESAFIALAEAIAALGHDVECRSEGARALEHRGVRWRAHDTPWPARADLYIANRDPRLLTAPMARRRTLFWLHNPAQFLAKPRYWLRCLIARPVLVFLGPSHLATAPRWTPDGGRVIIGHGIEAPFLTMPRAPGPPPPRAIFTSNPQRGLAPLLRLWRDTIRPRVPGGELHIFSGAATYAGGGRDTAIEAALAAARALAAQGVVLRAPVPKAALAAELAAARVLIYLGDPGETFCLAVGEALAMGAPAVVKPIGAVGERVDHGRTGFVERDDAAFCDSAVRLLTDDALWRAQSEAALATRATLGWDRAAREFLALI
jgi:glycosyltransferase involved in cell wall biosynthesis